ncbi:hypothetical protein AMATHDRAFT_71995 [Amanita thiersii Skay4041]|uniref:Peptidase C15, pyroglutamyl peptidase I-like protein n=1 Tax=Amanita thiersii Skay4041 TaxID=703135 RepID=A0A2A9N708_9AGAR|nr:hypothetical protein AMATHDRAFT_71995 [Amanita thiersii Skay4041]
MGDASLPRAQADLQGEEVEERQFLSTDSLREVNVLVTGFGPFKSFGTNPSYLIASSLSHHLNPESESASAALKQLLPSSQYPICDPDPRPYKVNVHVYPPPIRVAYDVVRELIPRLVVDPENGFDYVLHIGVAAGRENYTLETIAHRDHYKLKDVDEQDGSRAEAQWKVLGLPAAVDVGWNKEDVLSRWEVLTRQREDEYEREEMEKAGWREGSGMTLVEMAQWRSQVFLGKGKRAAVKLSKDAGRYLCECIFYTSLGTRWREARDAEAVNPVAPPPSAQRNTSKEKVGKVAFLHVPGGTGKHDIARGVRVAESAILAIVGSWESGYRNPDVYGRRKSEKGEACASPSIYESKGTGDR